MMVLTLKSNKATVFDNEYKISKVLNDADAVNIGNAFLQMGEARPQKALVSRVISCILTVRTYCIRRSPPPNWLCPRARAAGSQSRTTGPRTPAPREVPA